MDKQAGTILTRHDLEAKIVKRCWEDESFRREFTTDPSGAFTKYLQVPGEGLPKIVMHQEEPGSWHIVVPAKPAHANELSEEDLERIAGGSASGLLSLGPMTPSLAALSTTAVGSGLLVGSGAVVVDKIAGW